MSELDLTAAVDAAQPLIDAGGYIYETPKAEDVIRAALPHILEALAKVADSDEAAWGCRACGGTSQWIRWLSEQVAE